MPYANARVEISKKGLIELISYTTTVATIDPFGFLTIYGLYSMTTRKHISAFVKEYANTSYQTARQIYEDNLVYNIHTGEVIPIEKYEKIINEYCEGAI